MTSTATMPPAEARLPTPEQRPEADVVIYDGHCKFCTAQVQKLTWWDCQSKLSYMSLHNPEVARRYPDLTHEWLMEQMYVVERHTGRRHGGAAAFRYLSRRLRRLWWLAPLMHIPFSLPVWQWLYRQVARRRYLFGTTSACDGDACRVHTR